jgi:hypothetical protein
MNKRTSGWETFRSALDAWKRFGAWMGTQVARVVFTALYFTLLLPFALGGRLGPDRLRRNAEPTWLAKMDRDMSLSDSRRPF